MPTRLELRAEPRSILGKHVRRLRREGIVPANIYGHGASRAIQAPARAVDHLLTHGGRTGLVSIAVDGRTETALVKGIQRDPRSGKVVHVEFQAVSMEESVTSSVPLRFVGESVAVTKLDGVLTFPKSEVRITARARDLPESIEVDVSVLEDLNSSIKVGDLLTSTMYTLDDAADDVIALVQAPKVQAEELVAAEEAAEAESEAAAAGEATTADEGAAATTESEEPA